MPRAGLGMEALDEATLTSTLGQWLDGRSIRAMLRRRDAMKKAIEEIQAVMMVTVSAATTTTT